MYCAGDEAKPQTTDGRFRLACCIATTARVSESRPYRNSFIARPAGIRCRRRSMQRLRESIWASAPVQICRPPPADFTAGDSFTT